MDYSDVVAYGCNKLGLKADKGSEEATLNGFLQGARVNDTGYVVDAAVAKAESFVDKHYDA